MNFQVILDEVYQEVKAEENTGAIATYIPELGKVDTEKFGVALLTTDRQYCSAGTCDEAFSIQSIAKVLSLSLAYREFGSSIWKRVDVEPSGTPFNSLIQLESDNGIPRNPLINGGAIVICDILLEGLADAKLRLIEYIRALSGNPKIDYDSAIAKSEKETGFRNIALVNFIKSFGNIKNDPELVLDLYFHLCSIKMTCGELTNTFWYLANNGKNRYGKEILNPSETKRINAIMQTCGFYDEAGEFAYRVGLPGKSGVGGGIVAIHPDHYCIAVWSPRLNQKGNSYRGMKFLERFTTRTNLSIF